MDLLRRAANLGRSLRAKHKLKTRQVLPSMLVITRHAADRAAVEQGAAILKAELNVKEIAFSTDEAAYVRLSLKPNLKSLGPRLGKQLGEMRQHLEAVSADPARVVQLLSELEAKGEVTVLGHALTESDFLIDRGPKDERLIATERGLTVLLDTRLTDELVQEGLAREVINRVQKLRKESGLNVSDRILLDVVAPDRLAVAVRAFGDYISRETLAIRLEVRESGEVGPGSDFSGRYDVDGMECFVSVTRPG